MTKYRGYYIDKVVFNNKVEIDNFIKEQAVKRFEVLNQIFNNHPSLEASIACGEQAKCLHDNFGFSWEEIEEMEIAAIV